MKDGMHAQALDRQVVNDRKGQSGAKMIWTSSG